MAHFAKIENGIVTTVLVVDDEFEANGPAYLSDALGLGGRWVQTSYNARIRGKFAGVGDVYDQNLDAFFPPQPFPSWVLATGGWVAPKPKPDGDFVWSEEDQDWIEQ